jgi:hypothetical protein
MKISNLVEYLNNWKRPTGFARTLRGIPSPSSEDGDDSASFFLDLDDFLALFLFSFSERAGSWSAVDDFSFKLVLADPLELVGRRTSCFFSLVPPNTLNMPPRLTIPLLSTLVEVADGVWLDDRAAFSALRWESVMPPPSAFVMVAVVVAAVAVGPLYSSAVTARDRGS